MKKILAVITIISLSAGWAFADQNTHRQAAKELLQFLKAEERMKDSIDQLLSSQKQQLSEMFASKDALALQKRIVDIYEGALNWDEMREEFIDVYTEYFSEEELKQILSFYSSDVGIKLLEKQPEISKKTYSIGADRLERILPEIQGIIRDEVEKIKSTKK